MNAALCDWNIEQAVKVSARARATLVQIAAKEPLHGSEFGRDPNYQLGVLAAQIETLAYYIDRIAAAAGGGAQ